MPITAERLEVDVQANTADAGRDLDKFGRTAGNAGAQVDAAGAKATSGGRKFSAAGALVKAATGTMIAGLAGRGIMAASDLNEQLSKTGTVFGPQAKIVTDGAQQMADAFGMDKAVFLDAASGIGLVGKASGLTKKAAAGLSVDMAKLAADASSFYNVPVTEALDAMKSGLVGEAEPMRKFGVLMNEATVNAEAMALGIVKPVKNTVELAAAQGKARQAQQAYTDALAEHGRKSPEATAAALALQKAQEAVGKAAKGVIPELTEGQKVQARSSLIMKGMGDASGDLAKTQDSVANRLRELQGRAVNFAADMGTKALPAVELFLGALIKAPGKVNAVKNAITGWTDSHPKVTKAIGFTAAAITTLFIPAMVRAATVATVTKVKVVAAWVAQQAAAIRSAAAVSVALASNIAFYVQYGAIVVAQMARTAAAWVAAQAKAVAAMAVQAAGLARLAAAYVAQGAVMAASMAATAARTVAAWVLMGVQSMIQAARMAAAWVIAMGPVGWAIAAAVAVGVAIYKNWDKIVAATKAAWSAVSGALSTAWTKIKSVVMAGVNMVIGFVKNNWQKIVAILLGPLGIAVGLIVANWGRIKAAFSSGIQTVKNLWSAGWNAVKSFVSRAWDGIVNAVKSGTSRMMGWVQGIPGKITGALSGLGSLLTNAGIQVIEGFWSGLKSKWEDVKAWFGSVTDAIPNLKGPRAKDRKLLIENGEAVMEGFKEGLNREWSDVKALLKAATKWVGNSAMDEDTSKALEKRLGRISKTVKALLAKNARLAEKYAAAVQEHADKVQAKADFRQSTFQGMNAQANVMNAGSTGSSIAASLAAQVQKVQEFGLRLANLAARGLNRDAIAQIAAAGVEGGSAVAEALSGATDTELGSINASFAAIGAAATSTADYMASNLHDAGISVAQGVVEGLQAKQDAIKSTLRTIADGMVDSIREVVKKATREAAAEARATADAERSKTAQGAATVTSQTAAGGDGRGPGGGQGPQRPGRPADRVSGGNDRQPRAVNFSVTAHNPVAEPVSRTVNKGLNRAASLGLV